MVQGLKVTGTCSVLFWRFFVSSWHMHWLTEDCLLLQSDATYLVVTDDGQIEKYGLNAVCTHLGCVVPWNNVSPLTAL